MPSLKEIAADIGVSHALVSRVLNNRMGTTGVSKKTREAILQRAKELDYQPNPLALALKQGRKGAVGVFYHSVGTRGSELISRFLESVGNSLAVLGTNMLLRQFDAMTDFQDACDAKLLRKIDGLIIAGVAHPQIYEKLRSLEAQGLPVTLAWHGAGLEGMGIVNFQVNSMMQSYLTTRHLLDTGCRRVAHFLALADRYDGYRKAHADVGVRVDGRLIIPAVGAQEEDTFRSGAGYECMRRLTESGAEFDGISAQSDAQAAGAMNYLALKGVPRDRWPKITGIDDSPIASEFSLVPLTSSTAEMETCARLAVEALTKKLDGETVESQVVMPQLVIRESTM